MKIKNKNYDVFINVIEDRDQHIKFTSHTLVNAIKKAKLIALGAPYRLINNEGQQVIRHKHYKEDKGYNMLMEAS